MEPHILFEDEDIIVVDKPSGLIVNTADTTAGEETLQEIIERYLHIPSGMSKVSNTYSVEEVFRSRAGIVHRLDKETSGAILVAKNIKSFQNLQLQFKERRVKKVYIALVHGKVEKDGEIAAPIGRLPWNRMRFGVLPEGREAMTKYKVLSSLYQVSGKNKEPLTLLELYPETGRTHQIRVHVKHINHPIFGDFLYAGRKTARSDRSMLSRIFLHASTISFDHPQSGASLTFESPLSKNLVEFLNRLKN